MFTDGIIFDLDGTLWDSCRSVAGSWQRTVRRFDPERLIGEEDIRAIMGMTPRQVADRLFPGMGDRGMELCRRCLDEECAYIARHGGEIYPDAEAVLSRLSRRCPLYIVSNCAAGYIETFLGFSGFGRFFSGFLDHDATGLDKSENIRLLIEREGLERPVYVGDTAQDRRNALDAGCAFVFAGYGFGEAGGAGPEISCLAELEAVLEQL